MLALLVLLVWAYMLAAHGKFWQTGPVLARVTPVTTPRVALVVPARNEAAHVADSLRSLLAQDYTGSFQVILVDDASTDDTGAISRAIDDPRLTVVAGETRPTGWSGKLWAVAQGVAAAGEAEFFFLTDADIVHDPAHLTALVARAERGDLDLVSEMVALRCESLAERALVPAFVYFFQMLYPFAWVNDPMRTTAAAAGGVVLIRRRALERIGGISAVRGALIDDVTLAAAVKQGGKIWLGHAELARSMRDYAGFGDIWRMIARTAFTQLRYSWVLLGLTVLGMLLVFVAPVWFLLFGDGVARLFGLLAWAGMTASFWPSVRRYGLGWWWAMGLPIVAMFYTAATVDSALMYARGIGVRWKDRAYTEAGT